MDATSGTTSAENKDSVPTLFEWAGGAPALLRMTTIFYRTYVPDDPLLGPLFAEMAPDHPERVAAWLGEVFGGPRSYTERFGDYDRMVSRHLGRALSEEQRARWVQLLCRSADDAGLPTDPEWRAAFVAYLEWGSRIAVENSQPGAHPAAHMPVPRWSWVDDATPGSRVSALAEQPPEPQADLPRPDEQLSFAQHVKPLFREGDRRSMRFAFDLWSHETWPSTPGRSSIAYERGRCRATGRGPRTASLSSSAGSTRERPPEACEVRSRAKPTDDSSIPPQP